MGANYVEAVFLEWAHLPDREFRALVRMALVPPDYQPNPRYWGGWEVIAYALGCDMPHDDDVTADAQRLRANAQRRVQRAIAELVTAEAIARVRAGGRNRRAEYLLNLTPVDKERYA